MRPYAPRLLSPSRTDRPWRRLQRCLVLLPLVLAAGHALGTEPDARWARLASPVFGHITSKNGLPSDTLSALAQGSDGFVWIGTQSGLVRYDGYRFRTFTYDSHDPHSLPGDFVQAIYPDAYGNLWVGTATGGLARFDREHENFVRYGEGDDGQSGRDITAIAGDGADGVWIGTAHELEHRDLKTGALQHLPRLSADLGRVPDAQISSLLEARDGMLWIGTDAGLARWRPGSPHATLVPIHAADNSPLILDNVAALFEDSHKQLWFGTSSHGLGFVGEDGHGRLFDGQGEVGAELARQSVHAISEIAPGVLWIATYGGGVFEVRIADKSVKHFQHVPALGDSLGDDQCLAILQDRSGLVWIATENGLSTAEPNNTTIQTVFSEPDRSDRLHEGNVIGLMTDEKNNLWVGYHAGGLDVFDSSGERTHILRPGTTPDTLPHRTVGAMARSGANTVWLGTSAGLFQTDLDTHGVTRITLPGGSTIPFVQFLWADDDDLWIAGNQGLQHYAIKTHQWQVIDTSNSTLSDNRVTSFARMPSGEMWVGTLHGLNRLDRTGHVLEKTQVDLTNAEGLGNDFVTDLAWDGHQRLWVGTGGGLYVLLGRDQQGRPRFGHVGPAEGLTNPNISALETDHLGRIWASSDGGVALIDPDTQHARPYRRADGVVISNYWNSSRTITGNGTIAFGGIGGITVIHPDEMRRRDFRPPIVVTDVRVGSTTLESSSFNHSGAISALLVPPNASGFAVEFAALDYSSPLDNRYTYKLDGFDHDWIPSDATRRIAAYTNLAPGSYVLRVRGSGRDGVWAATELALPIRVLPAWYQTWPVHLLEVAGVLGALLLVVRARTAYLHRRQRELEALVQLRTEELSDSKKRLEEIAFFDPLTNLPNRRFFAERFDQFRAIAERSKMPFALILIDLDHFKEINDGYGHDAGDKVLIETARRLRAATREVDCVTRLGGDEFAILLDHANPPSVLATVCGRVVSALSRPIDLAGTLVPVAGTLGAAVFPTNGTSQEALYKAADVALYEAKSAGRNTWRSAPSP